MTVKTCRLGIRQEDISMNIFTYEYPISKRKGGGESDHYLHGNSDIFYFCAIRNQCNGETEIIFFEEPLVKGTLISSISLQQEISAMVKQKCLYKVLLHRNSDIFYISATRNLCNDETEMSFYSFTS